MLVREKLRDALQEKGISQVDAARELKLSQSFLCRILHGERGITLSLARALAGLAGGEVDPVALVDESERAAKRRKAKRARAMAP